MYKFFSDKNLSILYNLVLDKNIQLFMHSLVLQKILEKTQMKEILAVVSLSTYKKHLILLLNMTFFNQNLNIMVYIVLLMNGLNLISQIENNMFQLMAMILILLMQYLAVVSSLYQKALKFCKVHHFADDTNLIHFSKFVNRLNKYVNLDLKNLTYWLNANRISLNVKKLSQ